MGVRWHYRGVDSHPAHTIRAARPEDAEDIAAIYATFVAMSAATFEEQAPTGSDMQQRMNARPRLPWLVAADPDGTILGFAYAGPHHVRSAYRWSANCSVYLRESAWGRGVASALYRDIIDAVRDLGYVSLFAGIALPNDASVALHERLGFQRIGVFPASGFKLGSWRDVGWWRLALRDPPAHPDELHEWPLPE